MTKPNLARHPRWWQQVLLCFKKTEWVAVKSKNDISMFEIGIKRLFGKAYITKKIKTNFNRHQKIIWKKLTEKIKSNFK